MARTLAAAAIPALAISIGWLRLEQPPRTGEVLAVALLALVPAAFPRWWQRALALACVVAGGVWLVSGLEAWRLVPPGDATEPLVRSVSHGIGDFYGVVLPFDPGDHAEMHMLLLAAVFGFTALTGLLVAARLPLAAAGMTLAGVGWPATLADAGAVGTGALALAAALSIFLALRVRSVPALAIGAAAAAVVISGAAWASNATTIAQSAILDWETWDFRGLPARALGVRFVWDANYDGVAFPSTQTVVLEIRGPTRAQYWRVSTLDRFTADRWLEDLFAHTIGSSQGDVPRDALTPPAARDREGWLEQRVEVKALVDDRLAAAGTPMALQAGSIGTAFFLEGGVIRARRALDVGTRYRVWSYVPSPSPTALAAAEPRYPRATTRHLTVWGRPLPPFGTPDRRSHVDELLDEIRFGGFGEYRPLFEAAQRIAGDAATPYAAVLALEEWFRSGGGFRYEEQPGRANDVAPLVHFVTTSRAGYCQHYAGAMALMLRFLGVPSRVAVGFTSGTQQNGVWKVTDHNAHAWVEVWFAGHGWVSFDPTPGRGTFAGNYSFASESAQAVDALSRRDLDAVGDLTGRGFSEREELLRPVVQTSSRPSLVTLALGLAIVGALVIGVLKWVVRRARYLTSDPRRLAAASRRELESFLRDQGVDLPACATLADLQRAVREEIGVDASAFVSAASRGRFGRPEACRPSARAARRELKPLLRRMRAETSLWMRLRGFVSLRSLRGSWQV